MLKLLHFRLVLLSFLFLILCILCICFPGKLAAQAIVLKPIAYKHYIDSFTVNDEELYKQYIPNATAWDFLSNNIPLFDCPEKAIERT